MNRHSLRLLTILVAATSLLAAGCVSEGSGPKQLKTDKGTFAVVLDADPAPAVPQKPIHLALELDADEADLSGITAVSLAISNPQNSAVDVPLGVGSDASLWTGPVVFPEAGEWDWKLTVTSGEESEVAEGTIDVGCPAASPKGGSCCETANCSGDLLCIVATCQAAPNDNGGACLGGTDCTSEYCEAGLCVPAPTCDDEKANGDETDLDCGGPTCGACADGLKCNDPTDCLTEGCEEGICIPPLGWQIGKGDGSPDSVFLEVILASAIYQPADLAFNPEEDNELWIVSPALDQLTVVVDPGTDEQALHYFTDSSRHFLEEVISLSFGPKSQFATCGDSNNTYDGFGTANNFMGPSLWPSSVQEFYDYGPDPAKVHLDMLHSTPNCMGMASDGEGQYFAFNGYHGTLDWYDFGQPHPDKEHGGEDHTDGKKRRYVNIALKRVAGVPSHLELHEPTGMLYIADTGNGRILQVYTDSASVTGTLQSFGGDGIMYQCEGEIVSTIVPQGSGLIHPSGLAIHEDLLFVTDNKTGIIHVFTLEGDPVRTLDTGLGSGALAGIAVGPVDGLVYIVGRNNSRIYRINP